MGHRQLDLVSIIKRQREKDGRASGITKEEIKKTAILSIKSDLDEIRDQNDSGPFSDMTSVMRRSDQEDKERAKFVNDSEFEKTEQEIKDEFLAKAASFDDLLAIMGNAKHGMEGLITYADFNRAVVFYCGHAKYSSFQIKFVFQHKAVYEPGIDKSEVDKGYIPILKFKDLFYPGRVWRPEYMNEIDKIKAALDEKEKSFDIESESMRISTIMQGRNKYDL